MSRHNKITFSELVHDNVAVKIGTPSVYVILRNQLGRVLMCYGSTKPTDNDNGYATGCFFMDTDDGAWYINHGDHDNCDFDVVTVA